ncbi:MAG: hypothetical protein IKU32_00630 [Clostridia bacterium]|nr:hypothetical protein [Clostridia bacterium]
MSNTKKTNWLKINHDTKTLIMDRTFAKKAAYVGDREYNILQEARRDYPEYQVITRAIKKKEDKECYRGLTYKYMEDYIRTHTNAAPNMAEFQQQLLLAKCHSIRYANIKKWFLASYPEVAQFGVTEIAESKVENALSIVKGEAELQAA